MIDEFQYAKEGGKKLKYIYDKYRIKILISGSSSVELTVKALGNLVGRIFIFELFPFDFKEFLKAKDKELAEFYNKYILKSLKKTLSTKVLKFGNNIAQKLVSYFEEYIIYGGYPRVVLAQDTQEKKEILKGIYSTFFLREVRDYLGLIEDYKLHSLIKVSALGIGNLIDYNELSKESGYSFLSVKKYLNFLEKTYIISLITPFFKNRRKEITKNPKLYFIDTGLRNYIVKDFRKLNERPDTSFLLENIIFTNLRKKDYKPHYWRTKTKKEIDFIIPQEKIALEVKNNIEKCKENPSTQRFKEDYPEYNILFLYLKGFNKNTFLKNIKRFPLFVI